jgi:hypothetical protein
MRTPSPLGATQLSTHPTPAYGPRQSTEKLADDSQEPDEHPICFTMLLREAKRSAEGKENLRRYLASVANATKAT